MKCDIKVIRASVLTLESDNFPSACNQNQKENICDPLIDGNSI